MANKSFYVDEIYRNENGDFTYNSLLSKPIFNTKSFSFFQPFLF